VRALVTGAAGFIGAHVADALRAAGHEVRTFDADRPPGPPDGDHVAGDVRDEAALTRAMTGCDAVFHLAAVYSFARRDAAPMMDVNVEGTRAVLAAAQRAGVGRVVHTSSCATCGPAPGRLADERDHPPAWELKVAYKRSKLASERLALDAAAAGRDVVVVNPTTPVGPGDRRPTPTGKMIRDAAAGRMRAHLATTGLNVADVRDIARGHVLAHELARPGERYLLGGDNLPLAEVFALVAREHGHPPPRVRIPFRAALGAAWAADRIGRVVGREPTLLVLDEVRLARIPAAFSIEKARRELGYTWRPAADALRDAARAA
jgi:dihydroflavonol-4-reductase